MKKYAPLLLVAIVAFFAGTWFGSRREYGKPEASAADVPRGASEVSPPALEAGTREERAPAGGSVRPRKDRLPADPQETAREPGELERLRQRLRELLATRSQNTPAWREVLERLVRLGSAEGIALVLEAMESPDCRVASAEFARLLGPVEDERIFASARAVLERNLEQGLDSWFDTWGYLELVAAKGGARAGEVLAALLREGGQLAAGAAQNVKVLDGVVAPDPFLNALRDPAFFAGRRELAESLAQWSDPRVRASLADIASSAEAPMELRLDVLRALASHASPEELQGFGRWYWSASDDGERVLALQALGYLGYAGKAEEADVRAAGLPLILDALEHSEREVWLAAVRGVADHEVFHVEAVRAALTALLASGTSAADLKEIRRSLSRVESSL